MPAEALPMALLRPLSGSGAYGIMASIINDPAVGPDSYAGLLVTTLQGSTETTFYVLAVYFGAIQVRRIRHTWPRRLPPTWQASSPRWPCASTFSRDHSVGPAQKCGLTRQCPDGFSPAACNFLSKHYKWPAPGCHRLERRRRRRPLPKIQARPVRPGDRAPTCRRE